MAKINYPFIITLFLTLTLAQNSVAKKTKNLSKISNILVSADEIVRDTENDRIDLRGDVQIIFKDQHLYCERATVDLKTKELIASGRVSMVTPEMTIEGDRVEMNYQTSLGIIYDGFVRSGSVTFEGKIVRKVGPREFDVEAGVYTACQSCPAAWSFSGRKIRAEMGGYAYIQQPIFRIAGYPFFWLPYLIVPLKSHRQTGFLFPTFGSTSDGGSEIAARFFWGIGDHKDATFTLKNYSKRGLKAIVNHRFYMDEESYGELDTAFISDQVLPTSPRLIDLSDKDKINRWYLKYSHKYFLPGGFQQKTNLNLVSDLQYLSDFVQEIHGQGEPALENRISLTKNSESWHGSVEAAYYLNLLKTNAKTDNDDAVHRFPEMKLSLTETEISNSGFLFQLNASYVNFARSNFAYDDILFDPNSSTPKEFNPNRDGQFNFDGTTTRDQIRTGQRFDIQPQVSYPLEIGPYLDVLPSLSFRETNYEFGVGEQPSLRRNFVRTEISMKTSLNRIYGENKAGSTRYKHEFLPELTYSNVPSSSQPNHPFFGSSGDKLPNFRSDQPITDNDFFADSGLQFDYFDRIVDQKYMRLALTNKLTRKTWSGDTPSYQQIGLFRLSQSYDFIEAEKGNQGTRPWSDIQALFDFRIANFNTNTVVTYFPYHGVTNTLSRVQVISDRGNSFQLLYTRRFIIGDETQVDKASRAENLLFSTGYISKYFNLHGGLDYSLVTSKVNSWSYQLQLKPPGNCIGFLFTHIQPVGGKPQLQFSFSYSFDGKTMDSFSSASLSQFSH